jgi:DNA polymerase-3 subunit chi
MHSVEFHTGLPDALDFACRLLRKAQRQGHRVLVTAPAPLLAALDARLWTFEPLAFVPHVQVGDTTPAVSARTPIWLAEALPAGPLPPVLVNMGAAMPADPQRFERIVELVSADADEAQAGRERWRQYKALGLEIVHHPARAVGGAQG